MIREYLLKKVKKLAGLKFEPDWSYFEIRLLPGESYLYIQHGYSDEEEGEEIYIPIPLSLALFITNEFLVCKLSLENKYYVSKVFLRRKISIFEAIQILEIILHEIEIPDIHDIHIPPCLWRVFDELQEIINKVKIKDTYYNKSLVRFTEKAIEIWKDYFYTILYIKEHKIEKEEILKKLFT